MVKMCNAFSNSITECSLYSFSDHSRACFFDNCYFIFYFKLFKEKCNINFDIHNVSLMHEQLWSLTCGVYGSHGTEQRLQTQLRRQVLHGPLVRDWISALESSVGRF